MSICPHINKCVDTVNKTAFYIVCLSNYNTCSTWAERRREDEKTPREWAKELKASKGGELP